MKQQLDSLTNILNTGSMSFGGRNGGTINLYGTTQRYLSDEGAPIPTTKKLNDRSVTTELEWFLKGNCDNRWLVERGVKIWNKWDCQLMTLEQLLEELELYPDPHSPQITLRTKLLNLTEYRNATEEKVEVARKFAYLHEVRVTTGYLGPVYGKMFRAWPSVDGATIDQISILDKNLRDLPMSRRHVISLWNPDLLPNEKLSHAENIDNEKQVLPPCHLLQHVMVEEMTIGDIMKSNDLTDLDVMSLLYGVVSTDLTQDARKYIAGVHPYILARFAAKYDDRDALELTYLLRDGEIDIESYLASAKGDVADLLDLIMECNKDSFREDVLGRLKAHGCKVQKVHLQFYMRSNDEPLGRPFNVFSYYMLKEIIANVHGFESGDLIQATGVAHIYENQLDAVLEQLTRKATELPTLKWKRKLERITDFTADDYELIGYDPQPFIKTPVSS